MISEVEDYFSKGCGRCARFATPECSVRTWHAGLCDLRQICLNAGLHEELKWGHPCYTHAGRNVAIFGAFRNNFRLTFFNAALLYDPEEILQKQGENTQTADMIRFDNAADVSRLEPVIRAYLSEAMDHAKAGRKPPKTERALVFPEELSEALASDPDLSEAFDRLTPGRQKSYLFNLNTAKKPETRIARIEKFRPKIMAGKGAQER